MANEATQGDRPTLHLVRYLNAPRALVWAAWTKPEMLVRWLGPVEFPSISAKSDLRVGGAWSATLQAADGNQLLRQHGMYLEVEWEQRLVFSFKWEGDHEDGTPVDTEVTVELSDAPDGRTRMEFTHAHLKSLKSKSGHRHGWMSSFGRLDDWLVEQPAIVTPQHR